MKRTLVPCLALAVATFAAAQDGSTYQSRLVAQMGIEQRLGAPVARDARLRDETGQAVAVGSLLRGRPTLFVPTRYDAETGCPNLQDAIMKVLAKTGKTGSLTLARDLDVVFFSLDPRETPKDAAAKKALIVKAFAQPGTETGWRLLTGDEASTKRLADSLGWRYGWDARKGIVNYPTGSVLVTPDGRISAYTIGNGFATREVEGNLAAAARGEIGRKADQAQMFGCIMVDPDSSRYTGLVKTILQVTGTATALALGLSIFSMSRKYKRTPLGPGGAPDA